MTRMARTNTLVQNDIGGQASVGLQRFNHQVPNIAGASDGVQPFAGDLTNAFNNFFGQVSKAADTMQQADFYERYHKAQNEAALYKQQGQADANRAHQENPNITAAEAEARLTTEQLNNNNYLMSYRRAIGSNIGEKVYADFRVSMANVNPANYEAEASKFWTEKFGSGTGDPTVDAAMQAQWMRNYEQDRVNFAGAAVKAAREDATASFVGNASVALNKPDFGTSDIADLATKFKSVYGFETDGANMARTLSALKAAAVPLGRTATQRFLASLHYRTQTADAGETTSIADQFPAQVREVEQQASAALEHYVTLDGQAKAREASTRLAEIISSNPDEFKRFEALTDYYKTVMPQLANTPGVGQGYHQVQGAALTELNKLSAYKLSMNRMGAFAANPSGYIPGFDLTEYKKGAEEYMSRNFNIFTGVPGQADEVTAMKAGQFLAAGVARFGIKAIPEEVVGQFASAVLSSDPATATRAAHSLRMLDGNGRMAEVLLGQNGPALAKFQYLTQGSSTIPYGGIAQRAASYDANTSEAFTQIQKNGGIKPTLFPGEKPEKQATNYRENFSGSKMAEAIDEAIGDKWGTPNMSAAVQSRVDELVTTVVADRIGRGLPIDDPKVIRNEVARRLKGTVVLSDGAILLSRDAPNATLDNRGNPTRIPIGNTVMNPITHAPEDTAQTLRDDMDSVTSGIKRLSFDGETGVSVSYKMSSEHRDINGQWLINKETDVPLHIPVGVEMKMQQQFNEGETDRKSWFRRWGSDTVKLTGDLKTDQALAAKYLHPSVQLVPQQAVRMVNGESKEVTVGYQLLLKPRFTGTTKMTIDQLHEAAVRDPRNALAMLEEIRRRQSMSISDSIVAP